MRAAIPERVWSDTDDNADLAPVQRHPDTHFPAERLRRAIKGRGTAWAVPHRFSRSSRESFDDGWGTPAEEPSAWPADDGEGGQRASRADEAGLSDCADRSPPLAGGPACERRPEASNPPPATEILQDVASIILSKVESPDIAFDLSINPYRGCEHGCIYCYARPTHSYLNLSPGIDFETRILAKTNAAELLRKALSKPGYQPQSINIGSVTDAYQPAEKHWRITRSVIEVLAEFQHAFSVITKSSLIERDLDLIAPMAQRGLVATYVSITTLEPELARTLEPRAPAPQRRLRTIRALAKAGVPVGVSVSPLIPFLNEPELERVLEAAAEAGATSAFSVVLRLPWEVNPLFQDWLAQHVPDRAERVMARILEMRGGRDNDSRFGTRMTGTGVWADLVRQRFDKACARLGLRREKSLLDLQAFTRPRSAPQVQPGPLQPVPVQQALF